MQCTEEIEASHSALVAVPGSGPEILVPLSGAAEGLCGAVGVSGRLLWLRVGLGIEVFVEGGRFYTCSFQVFGDVRLQLLNRCGRASRRMS